MYGDSGKPIFPLIPLNKSINTTKQCGYLLIIRNRMLGFTRGREAEAPLCGPLPQNPSDGLSEHTPTQAPAAAAVTLVGFSSPCLLTV